MSGSKIAMSLTPNPSEWPTMKSLPDEFEILVEDDSLMVTINEAMKAKLVELKSFLDFLIRHGYEVTHWRDEVVRKEVYKCKKVSDEKK